MKDKTIIKMGLTPSFAPFRLCNIRTFIYIYSILLSDYYNQKECQLIFQIDDTNPKKRIHSNEEIISFYENIGIINNIIPTSIVSQTENTALCDYYYNILVEKGYIIKREDNVSYFNIEKYRSEYGEKIYLNDIINGKISFNVSELAKNDMFAIKRSNGTYLYHFATCIDNIRLGLTHIIRGKNKMSSAAYQIILNTSLGIDCPQFLHLPLLLENKKTTEQLNNRSLLTDFLKSGYDLYPIISYLLSSGYGDSNTIYSSINQFSKEINLQKFHKHDGQFDINILNKTNKRYYNKANYEDYKNNIITTATLINGKCNLDNEILKLGYKNHLSYKEIIDILELQSNDEFEQIEEIDIKLLEQIISILIEEKNINTVIERLPQYNKKEIYELIRYFYIGTKKGYSCSAIKDIFEYKYNYQERANLIHNKMLTKRRKK